MSKEYATRYDELEKYVETDAAKCAFRTLLTTGRYYVYPNETKRSVKFRDRSSSRIPYSFIVTKRWLKFYVRTPAFESWQPFERTLVQRFGERFDRTQYRSNEGKPEWRVDLACVEDVEFLYRTCPDVPYPLVLAADASHDGPPPTVRGPRLGQSNRDPVFRNPTRSSSVGNTSSSARGDLQAITSYWCQHGNCIRCKCASSGRRTRASSRTSLFRSRLSCRTVRWGYSQGAGRYSWRQRPLQLAHAERVQIARRHRSVLVAPESSIKL